ncbi:MAG: glycosyltransferase family 4 protein [Flavobacteriaceae bacterium]|nr:glycosyltransferase family 4 protein [Flavobacteriaceae bacterium]
MNKRLLIIGFVWPEPNATAAGKRMLQLIEAFKINGFQITFVCTAKKSDKSVDLHNLNIQTHHIKLNDSSFDILLKEINPNLVLFDRFLTEEQFGWRVTGNCSNAIKILDTEDLHFLRQARHQAFKDNKEVSQSYLVNDYTKRELASIYRCDLSLIISKYELNLLIQTFKIDDAILLYVPFLIDPIHQNTINSYPYFEERNNFMCIGNFKHAPNWNAVLYLKNKIWPLIQKKLPKAELHIYGAYATEKVQQLNNKKEGFIIKGWADNAENIFKKYRICLAPLQFGAGLKGKLIDAMIYGTPSITSKIGAEAMHGSLPWNGFIADDIDDFIQKSLELYQNKKVWVKSQLNGVAIINQGYNKQEFSDALMNKVIEISNNLDNHRLKNITGIILDHHTLQSSKYLSKWIEEKNKNQSFKTT